MEVDATPWYEIIFVAQSIAFFCMCVVLAGVDTMGPTFIMTACGYLRSLIGRLDQLNFTKAYHCQRDLEKEIIACVSYHQQLLQLVLTNILQEFCEISINLSKIKFKGEK